MTLNDYIPVEALKSYIANNKDYYKELQNDCKKWKNETSFHVYQGVLKALNELEREVESLEKINNE